MLAVKGYTVASMSAVVDKQCALVLVRDSSTNAITSRHFRHSIAIMKSSVSDAHTPHIPPAGCEEEGPHQGENYYSYEHIHESLSHLHACVSYACSHAHEGHFPMLHTVSDGWWLQISFYPATTLSCLPACLPALPPSPLSLHSFLSHSFSR